jgi:hypothetical protein
VDSQQGPKAMYNIYSVHIALYMRLGNYELHLRGYLPGASLKRHAREQVTDRIEQIQGHNG